MSVDAKQHELEELRARVRELETELAPGGKPPTEQWQERGYYTAYYATTGFFLGGVAAMASLLFNIVGSLLFEKQPLELIRVYLTFPMGAQALDFNEVDNGLILAIGCCLYLGTGMVYGILFQLVLTWFTAQVVVGHALRRRQPAGAGHLADQFLRHSVLAAAAVVRRQLDRGPDSLVGRCPDAPGVRLDDAVGLSPGPYQPYRLETNAT